MCVVLWSILNVPKFNEVKIKSRGRHFWWWCNQVYVGHYSRTLSHFIGISWKWGERRVFRVKSWMFTRYQCRTLNAVQMNDPEQEDYDTVLHTEFTSDFFFSCDIFIEQQNLLLFRRETLWAGQKVRSSIAGSSHSCCRSTFKILIIYQYHI